MDAKSCEIRVGGSRFYGLEWNRCNASLLPYDKRRDPTGSPEGLVLVSRVPLELARVQASIRDRGINNGTWYTCRQDQSHVPIAGCRDGTIADICSSTA